MNIKPIPPGWRFSTEAVLLRFIERETALIKIFIKIIRMWTQLKWKIMYLVYTNIAMIIPVTQITPLLVVGK
jgi:hypothetical protein